LAVLNIGVVLALADLKFGVEKTDFFGEKKGDHKNIQFLPFKGRCAVRET